MSIRIKIAETDQELDHALWIRHEVFVIEDGKFGGKPFPGERLIDRFDVFPGVFHVIAYDGDEPIATMRLNKESQYGVPADAHFDFSEFREEMDVDLAAASSNGSSPPHRHDDTAYGDLAAWPPRRRTEDQPQKTILGSAGMLAVRMKWRRRRDVIRAMYKVAAGVCITSGATHIVAVVNHTTERMYHRLGFKSISGPIWSEEIGNYIVAIAASTPDFYNWAFGDFRDSPLEPFKDSFERIFVRAGAHVFEQGEDGECAYIIAEGSVDITKRGPNGEELILAHLARGGVFGELALIDRQPRSATATASADTELITLNRDAFMAQLSNDPRQFSRVLAMFSERLRKMDELIMVHVYSPEVKRLEFALMEAKFHTQPDRRHKGVLVFNGGPAALASRAAVKVSEAEAFLDERHQHGELEYSNQRIRFLR